MWKRQASAMWTTAILLVQIVQAQNFSFRLAAEAPIGTQFAGPLSAMMESARSLPYIAKSVSQDLYRYQAGRAPGRPLCHLRYSPADLAGFIGATSFLWIGQLRCQWRLSICLVLT